MPSKVMAKHLHKSGGYNPNVYFAINLCFTQVHWYYMYTIALASSRVSILQLPVNVFEDEEMDVKPHGDEQWEVSDFIGTFYKHVPSWRDVGAWI